jgi:hypothetical protein
MANLVQDKIEAAKVEAKAALEAQIKRIEREDVLRNLAPDYALPKRVSYSAYDKVDTITYEADNAEQVAMIIGSYRDKYGAFMPIGKYVKSCCALTAYPYKEYLDPDALKFQEDDAVEARNSKGTGFSSVSFCFYPNINGEHVAVHIDLGFRKYIQGFEGHIVKVNGHRANQFRKDAPSAYNAAAYRVNFGCSEDSADWRAVFNCDALLTCFEQK